MPGVRARLRSLHKIPTESQEASGHDFTACGKKAFFLRRCALPLLFESQIGCAAVDLLLWRPDLRPPETRILQTYCARVSFCIRSRLCAVATRLNSQLTRALPRSFTCRAARSCLAQPNTFSTSFRFLWLMANPSLLRSSSLSQLGHFGLGAYSATCGLMRRARN